MGTKLTCPKVGKLAAQNYIHNFGATRMGLQYVDMLKPLGNCCSYPMWHCCGFDYCPFNFDHALISICLNFTEHDNNNKNSMPK